MGIAPIFLVMDIKKFFTSGSKTVLSDDEPEGKYGSLDDEVVWVGSTGNTTRLLKAALTIALVTLVSLAGLYAVLGATLMRAVPSEEGLVVVRSGSFVGGNPEAGQKIYISGTVPNDGSVKTKLKHSFMSIPDAATLTAVAGPYGEITVNDEGRMFFKGSDTTYDIDFEDAPLYLSDEVLAICVSGACDVGVAYVIPKDHIYGEVVGVLFESDVEGEPNEPAVGIEGTE